MSFEIARHGGFGSRVGFLEIDAPVLQVLQVDARPRDGAANVVASGQDLELARQIPDTRFRSAAKQSFEPIHHNAFPGHSGLASQGVCKELVALRQDGLPRGPHEITSKQRTLGGGAFFLALRAIDSRRTRCGRYRTLAFNLNGRFTVGEFDFERVPNTQIV